MIKKIKLISILFILINFTNYTLAENNFFEEGKKKYNEKKFAESKFLFQRSIVFNPKDQDSYLYLAKIYNFEENKIEEQKNIMKKNLKTQNFYFKEILFLIQKIQNLIYI